MFERILIPLDGSELAEAVLTQVRRILFYKDAEVLLMQAIRIPLSIEEDMEDNLARLESSASKYIQGVERKLASQGARVRSVVREGPTAETILHVAAEEGASLIAMSTHGRSGIARWILGSIAEKVMRASPIPVLAVRSYSGTGPEPEPTGARELSIKRVLVAIDAAELSMGAVAPVIELARLFGSSALLVNVCEGHPACSVPVPQMTRAYDQFKEAGVPAEPLMIIGDPASGILDACEKHRADLIAISSHGRSGVSRWMLGSVAEKVLRGAAVPVLVIRSPGVSHDKAVAVSEEEEVKA